MELLYFWMILTIIFILIEMFTATFYGLSLALSSLIVAFYVYFTWSSDHEILHALIFVVSSAFFAYFLPRILQSRTPDMPQGTDRYIGEKRSVKKVAWDLKISLDGVEYLIDPSEEIAPGDKVEVIGHKWVSMKVKKVK
jgi:membrane protein implicated in regulation of membrane protease activity